MKLCRRCGETKALSEFNRDRANSDGLQGACKPCQVEQNRQYVERHREKVNATKRAWEKANRQRAKASVLRWRNKNPEKHRAQRTLEKAVERGHIVKPDACSRCSESVPVQGHHTDYSRPLDVVWLCDPCHRAVHRELRTVQA